MIKNFNKNDISVTEFVVSKTIVASSKRNTDVLLFQTDTLFDNYICFESAGLFAGMAILTEDTGSYYTLEHGLLSASAYTLSTASVQFLDSGAEKHIISS